MTKSFFSALFNAVSLDVRVGERTQSDIDFIVGKVDLPPGAAVADLGCGTGRHSIELARRGFAVDGYDDNEDYLTLAREELDRSPLEGSVRFISQDLRDGLPWQRFDLVVCLHTSFGYFDDFANAALLQAAAASLKPGGTFVLEMTNRDPIVAASPEIKIETIGEITVIKENGFDVNTSRRELSWTYLQEDRVVERSMLSHRLYSPHELRSIVEKAGLSMLSMTDGFSDRPIQIDTRKLLVLARRPSSGDAGR